MKAVNWFYSQSFNGRLCPEWLPINELHFDNSRRYQVLSDGDGHYRVRDTQANQVMLTTIASDYARMKANDLNRTV